MNEILVIKYPFVLNKHFRCRRCISVAVLISYFAPVARSTLSLSFEIVTCCFDCSVMKQKRIYEWKWDCIHHQHRHHHIRHQETSFNLSLHIIVEAHAFGILKTKYIFCNYFDSAQQNPLSANLPLEFIRSLANAPSLYPFFHISPVLAFVSQLNRLFCEQMQFFFVWRIDIIQNCLSCVCDSEVVPSRAHPRNGRGGNGIKFAIDFLNCFPHILHKKHTVFTHDLVFYRG